MEHQGGVENTIIEAFEACRVVLRLFMGKVLKYPLAYSNEKEVMA